MKLTKQQQQNIAKIGKEYDLKFLILHGSYATGKEREGSDLDIAVLGEHSIGFEEFFNLQAQLSEVFGDNSERELDVKTLEHKDSLFRYLVVREGILLYGNETAYNEFKAYAYRAYVDSYDLRALEETLLRKSIGKLSQRYA